jgi:hypothetical protein
LGCAAGIEVLLVDYQYKNYFLLLPQDWFPMFGIQEDGM